MAEGSAHLCRCTIVSIVILFICSLGFFIAAFNINAISGLLGLSENGGNKPTAPPSGGMTFNYTSVSVTGGDMISVRLANWVAFNSSATNSTKTYVVMLHGIPESSQLCWQDILTYMRSDWIYIMPDLRGIGNSTRVASSSVYYTISSMVSDVAAVVAATVPVNTTINLVGFDYGGYVAVAYAHMYNTSVRTLTLLEATHPYAIQSQLQNSAVQQSNFSQLLSYILPTADGYYPSFNGWPFLENSTWFTSRLSQYQALWSMDNGNEWAATLKYWRNALILSPTWDNGGTFNANTTFNWSFNATAFPITCAVRMIYGWPGSSWYTLPGSASLSSLYMKRYQPPTYIQNGTHWINHGMSANVTAMQITQSVLSP